MVDFTNGREVGETVEMIVARTYIYRHTHTHTREVRFHPPAMSARLQVEKRNPRLLRAALASTKVLFGSAFSGPAVGPSRTREMSFPLRFPAPRVFSPRSLLHYSVSSRRRIEDVARILEGWTAHSVFSGFTVLVALSGFTVLHV